MLCMTKSLHSVVETGHKIRGKRWAPHLHSQMVDDILDSFL